MAEGNAMSSYRRVISVVEPSDEAAHIIRRAAQIARLCGAALAVASVVDHPPGGDESIRTRLAFISDATRRIERLAGRAGARDFEVLISERERHLLSGLVGSWQPDLVVVAASDPRGLSGWLNALHGAGAAHRVDVLKVEPEPAGIGRSIAATFAGFF